MMALMIMAPALTFDLTRSQLVLRIRSTFTMELPRIQQPLKKRFRRLQPKYIPLVCAAPTGRVSFAFVIESSHRVP
jgi:hypothetical protein